MKCMRCGSSITAGSVFCEECLADMEKHPVKPGTPINLPRREKQQPVKRSKKRTPKPEEQISNLHRMVAFLITLVIMLTLALTAAGYLLVTQSTRNDSNHLSGQNYGTSAAADR